MLISDSHTHYMHPLSVHSEPVTPPSSPLPAYLSLILCPTYAQKSKMSGSGPPQHPRDQVDDNSSLGKAPNIRRSNTYNLGGQGQSTSDRRLGATFGSSRRGSNSSSLFWDTVMGVGGGRSSSQNTYNLAKIGQSSSRRGPGATLGSSRRVSHSSSRFWDTVMGVGGVGSCSESPANAYTATLSVPISETGKLQASQSYSFHGGAYLPPPFPERVATRKKVRQRNPSICQLCKATFSIAHELGMHYKKVHPDRPRPFNCTFCSMNFARRTGVISHTRAVHERKRPFECEICDKKFAKTYDLNTHLDAVHRKIRRFVCDTCASLFVSPVTLKRHIRNLHPPTTREGERCRRRKNKKNEGA